MPKTFPCPYCGTYNDDDLESHSQGCPTRKYMEDPKGYGHIQALIHWILGFNVGVGNTESPTITLDASYKLGHLEGEAYRDHHTRA